MLAKNRLYNIENLIPQALIDLDLRLININ